MSKAGYTVATQNRFADLLSDDDSDSQQQKVVKPKATPAPKPSADTEGPRRPARRAERKPAGESKPTEAGRKPPTGETAGEDPVDQRPVRRSAPRGGLSQRGQPRLRGGRPFDRQSGTGRGKEMKRSGAGGHNWGNTSTDFGGETSTTVEPPADSPVVDDEAKNNSDSGPETISPPPVEKSQERIIDYAEYQRTQKLKRVTLVEDSTTTVLRMVNEDDLKKAGFQKYEREETPEERAARELQMTRGRRDDSEEEEQVHRPKTYNLSEFNGPLSRPRGRRGGRGGEGRHAHEVRETRRVVDPVTLDLADASAFPSLV